MNSTQMLHFKPKSHPFLLSLCHHLRHLTTAPGTELRTHTHLQPGQTNPITPVNRSHLLKVCQILYHRRHSSDEELNTHLSRTDFHLTHEFFFQVCRNFYCSWKPVYRFHIFTQTQQPVFHHTFMTFNKMLSVVGKARNIELFWELTHEAVKLQLVNIKTFIIVLKTLASVRELNRCVEFFYIMNNFGYEFCLDTLNTVVESLCKSKLVDEANHVVLKLKDVIKPNGVTYKWLIYGYCDIGNTIEASRMWNLLVDEGFELEIDVVEIMIDRLFKDKSLTEALKLFQSMRLKRMDDLRLSSYRLVIKWLCKKGKLSEGKVLLEEMQSRGIKPDNETLASIVYGLLTKRSVDEAYKVVEGIEKPDISIYHSMIKGFLRVKRASEATQVFREMIKRGCEPTMHTYIMLLQGHMGKRGKKEQDPLVNFDTIFVGGLVKAWKTLEATKYTERILNREQKVPRFDYNKFLYYFSNKEGVVMFEVMAKKLREVGLFDLADIFERYGERMTTRERRIISFRSREQLTGANLVSGEPSKEQKMQQIRAENSEQQGAFSGAVSTQEIKENVAKHGAKEGVEYLPKADLDKNDDYDSSSRFSEDEEIVKISNLTLERVNKWKELWGRPSLDEGQFEALVDKLKREDGTGGKMPGYIRLRKRMLRKPG